MSAHFGGAPGESLYNGIFFAEARREHTFTLTFPAHLSFLVKSRSPAPPTKSPRVLGLLSPPQEAATRYMGLWLLSPLAEEVRFANAAALTRKLIRLLRGALASLLSRLGASAEARIFGRLTAVARLSLFL